MTPLPKEAVVEKSRYSGFYGTNLDNMLRSRGIEHLIMLGGFTDACLLETVYGAWSRNYTISLVKDASTAGSEGAHKAAVLTMANWVWGISIFDTDEMVKAIKGQPYQAWFWERSHAFPYTTSDIDTLYNQLK
jgi:nicotinamidase-related amidase